MLEMVNDTSSLTHPRRGNDDTRSPHGIEPLAVLRRRHKVDVARGKDIAIRRKGLQRLLVITFRVAPEHARGFVGQRGIDIDGNGIDPALAHQFLDPHDQFLRAPHREGRHDDLALVLPRMGDQVLGFLLHFLAGLFVQPVAVRGLQNQDVAGGRRLGIAQDRHVGPSQISTE